MVPTPHELRTNCPVTHSLLFHTRMHWPPLFHVRSLLGNLCEHAHTKPRIKAAAHSRVPQASAISEPRQGNTTTRYSTR
jgi:hypothetical protein